MPSEANISTTLELITEHNPTRALPPIAHDTYAAEAFSLAALHEQKRLTHRSAAAVFRFWNPYIKPDTGDLKDLVKDIDRTLKKTRRSKKTKPTPSKKNSRTKA